MFLRFIRIFFVGMGTLGAILFVFLYSQTKPTYPLVSDELKGATTTPPRVETSGTSTPKISEAPKPKQTLPQNSITKPAAKTQPIQLPLQKTINTDELYALYQPAVLNIWCVEGVRATSGTATLIHPSGILITNAHVVRDIKNVNNCVLRAVNPFANVAEFEILYIPDQTAVIETTDLPQNDFAFLKITTAFDRPADTPWPFVPLGFAMPDAGDTLFIFGYATEFVGFEISVRGIPLTFSTLTVSAQATIDEDNSTAEALILGGGLSAQSGSSGGPLVDFNKTIVALMSFVTKDGDTTADRKGAAILISHMDRELKKETGMTIKEFLDRQSALAQPAATSTPL